MHKIGSFMVSLVILYKAKKHQLTLYSTVIFGIFNAILTLSTPSNGIDAIAMLGWGIDGFMIVITYLLWRYEKKH